MMKQLFTLILLVSLVVSSCSDTNIVKENQAETEALQQMIDSLEYSLTSYREAMENQMIISLTFQDNNAESAMKFYLDIFEHSRIISVERWGASGPVKEGAIMQALFDLDGNRFMVSDSPPVHDWDFSPAVSSYIECKDEGEMDRLFSRLSENGTVTMPPADYGFSRKFAWVIDQFGVSWQLNLD